METTRLQIDVIITKYPEIGGMLQMVLRSGRALWYDSLDAIMNLALTGNV